MYFFRLIRPLNLLAIVLTMYSCRWFVLWFPEFMGGINYVASHTKEPFLFALLVFSTVLIAAAGNIINDYFDVKADRINKPDQLIIGKFIKPRWAIISHIGFNSIALLIVFYLSLKFHTIWFAVCHIFSISCLWYYSTYYKKKPFLGNVLVAGLTAMIPLLVAFYMYFYFGNVGPIAVSNKDLISFQGSFAFWYSELHSKGIGLILLSFTALIANLAREILKDMEDIEGDKVIYANTLPMVFGFQKSKKVISGLLIVLILFFIVLLFMNAPGSILYSIIILFPVGLSFIVLVCSLLVLRRAVTRKKLKKADFLIKISFFLAILLPLYWLTFLK